MMNCSGHGFLVSASTVDGVTTATPTRHFPGTHKFLCCWLYGRKFKTSDEAFAAMHAHGYGDVYYSRSSVVLPLFAGLKHCQDEAKFDALYRYYKWCIKHGDCYFPMSRQGTPLQVQRAKLRRLAEKVGIFHSVAWVFVSPRCTRFNRFGHESGPMEVSLLGRKEAK